MIYAVSGSFVLLIWLTIVYLNERHGLLSCDRFSSAAAKWFAYLWLGALMVGLALVVTRSALNPATTKNMGEVPFWSVFELHIILLIFLFGWWAATGFPKLREFLNIRHEKPAEVVAIGVSVGVGGWILTLIISAIIVLLLQAAGVLEKAPAPPAAIGWMAALPIWKKALIVLSAMTVEEAFFRSFLQKRIGLVASTVLFALAHFTYGNPVLLVGVTVISIIIGLTFYRTKNVIPGVLAHGVFDAVQLFVIVPLAYKLISAGP
jgi:membrane protease YdiL (CAAX protease family)